MMQRPRRIYGRWDRSKDMNHSVHDNIPVAGLGGASCSSGPNAWTVDMAIAMMHTPPILRSKFTRTMASPPHWHTCGLQLVVNAKPFGWRSHVIVTFKPRQVRIQYVYYVYNVLVLVE